MPELPAALAARTLAPIAHRIRWPSIGWLLAACALAHLPTARADFVVSGQFDYVDRQFTFADGFTGSEPRLPIRQARVEVFDVQTGASLGVGATDDAGAFSFLVTGTGTADVEVRCTTRPGPAVASGPEVTDVSGQVYELASAVFTGWDLGTDLDIGQVVAPMVQLGPFRGSPFNVYDQLVRTDDYIDEVHGSALPLPVTVRWPSAGGTSVTGSVVDLDDSDGYDDVVQLRAIAQVVQTVFSDDDSPGGPHILGDSDQDPRLAMSQGWALAFAAAVRKFADEPDPGYFLDCSGTLASGPDGIVSRMRLETGWPLVGELGGEADEAAIACALWDVLDVALTSDPVPGDDDPLDGSLTFLGLNGDQLLWKMLRGPMNVATDLTVHDLWVGFFSPIDYGNRPALEAVFDQWGMAFYGDVSEPNDLQATATPIVLSGDFGPTKTLFDPGVFASPGGEGDVDYYSFHVPADGVISVETRYPDGVVDAETYCDPRIRVYPPSGSSVEDLDSGVGRNASLANLSSPVAGTWYVQVDTLPGYRKTGSYQLRVTLESGPPTGGPPVISSTSPTAVEQVGVDGANQVTLKGSGFLGLTGVTVAGQALSGAFPPEYSIDNDSSLTFSMPLVATLGPAQVDLTGPFGSASTTVDVIANQSPTVELANSAPGFLLSLIGLEILMGGQVGDLVFLCASPDLVASPLPAVVDFAIGNNAASLFLLGTFVIPPSGYVEHLVPLAGEGLPIGFEIHVQTAHLLFSSGLQAPAAASNVQSGTVLF